MKSRLIPCALLMLACALTASSAKQPVKISLKPAEAKDTISRMIYGQFAEHLGACVYEGIWVGEDSDIPNTNGYRNDALQALKVLKVPVLRWPGGCFADDYHWRDGIGNPQSRPTLINNNWGGTQEDNSFGTHEFFNLCEMAGIEPYLSVNIGSGAVQEAAEWIEYVTSPNGPRAEERARNGRKEPWHLKYVGIGNESWGCGGSMRPEYYSDVYRRYSTYMHNQPGNKLYRIASGASDYDYNWTKTLMNQITPGRMDGLSLHYYTVQDWNHKGSSFDFEERDYHLALGKAVEIEPVIEKHLQIMDEKDPKHKVGLIVDEWGTWFDEDPGTTPGHLRQQNTMRDAMVAALSLNAFHRHADRIHMANIAQLANVLQTMWFTRGKDFTVTPTYHVFRMYTPHQDALMIPLTVASDTVKDEKGRPYPVVDATASRAKDGSVTVTVTNTSLNEKAPLEINLGDLGVKKVVASEILTAPSMLAKNTFEDPEAVKPVPFKCPAPKKEELKLTVPPLSILSVTLK